MCYRQHGGVGMTVKAVSHIVMESAGSIGAVLGRTQMFSTFGSLEQMYGSMDQL